MAEQALANKNITTANRMSEQALVDAALAQAKSNSQKTLATLAELREEIDLMKAEVRRVQSH